MDNKLDILTKKIYEQGVEKANHDSIEIVDNAKKEAEKIVNDAKAEAERIVNQANKEAEELKTKVKTISPKTSHSSKCTCISGVKGAGVAAGR